MLDPVAAIARGSGIWSRKGLNAAGIAIKIEISNGEESWQDLELA